MRKERTGRTAAAVRRGDIGFAFRVDRWAGIPLEILVQVAKYTDAMDVLRLSMTCRGLTGRMDGQFWRNLFIDKWGHFYRTDLMRPIQINQINKHKRVHRINSEMRSPARLLKNKKEMVGPAPDSVWRVACVVKASSAVTAVQLPEHRAGSIDQANESPHAKPNPLFIRQCRICNVLCVVTHDDLRRERDPDAILHSRNVWIRPCECSEWCHRKCLETQLLYRTHKQNQTLESLVRRGEACSKCRTPYRFTQRTARSFQELVTWTLSDIFSEPTLQYILHVNLPLMLSLLFVFTGLRNVKVESYTAQSLQEDSTASSTASWASRWRLWLPIHWYIAKRETFLAPSLATVGFCLMYHVMLLIFISPRFQAAVVRIFPGPLYWLYLKLYGSICFSFVMFVLTYSENPFFEYYSLPWVIRAVSTLAVIWWYVACVTIIVIFWWGSYRVGTPTDLYPMLDDVTRRQVRCRLCAVGMCLR